MNTNLRGTFVCSREAAKLMRLSGDGAIVNISSTRAVMSEPNSEAYAASKGGILSLTHALAVACLYLTGPGNDFVTGTHITIDGGMTRKMIYEE